MKHANGNITILYNLVFNNIDLDSQHSVNIIVWRKILFVADMNNNN